MKRFSVDLRSLVAAVLALLTGLLVLAATDGPEQVQAVIAGSDLPSGVPVADLEFDTVAMDLAPGVLTRGELDALDGHVLALPLAEGQLVTRSMLQQPAGAGPDAMAVSLDAAHAVQGEIRAGDRVAIFVTRDGQTTLLADAVEVLSVTNGSGSLTTGEVALTLAVDDVLAADLVAALHDAAIDVIRRAR